MLESYLSEILVRRGVVTEERLEPFFAQQRENGPSLMDLLVAGNIADARRGGAGARRRVRLSVTSRASTSTPSPRPRRQAPHHLRQGAQDPRVAEDDAAVHVVCADPLDTAALDDVRALFGKPVDVAVASARERRRRHQPRLRAQDDGGSELESDDENAEDEAAIDILDSDDEAPIIRWVNALFFQAVQGARQRHPHRARGERGRRPLPHRRRALRGQARQPSSS